MPDKMYLTVALRKEVEDLDQGRFLFEMIKTRLEDKPEITVTGNVSTQFKLED